MWNWSENQIELMFIRHGATEANKEHRYLGKTDEPLSAEGIFALQEAKAAGCYPEPDYLFSSPMKRCIETAGILYPEKEVIRVPEFQEMDFGIFEGKNYEELQQDERYQAWIDSNGTLPFPEGESREDFICRCRQGFYRMLKRVEAECLKTCKTQAHAVTVGVMVHGGTIMALCSSFCGGDYFDYQVKNGGGYLCRLEVDHEEIRLKLVETI